MVSDGRCSRVTLNSFVLTSADEESDDDATEARAQSRRHDDDDDDQEDISAADFLTQALAARAQFENEQPVEQVRESTKRRKQVVDDEPAESAPQLALATRTRDADTDDKALDDMDEFVVEDHDSDDDEGDYDN
jgi:hypothetical protein